MKASAINANVPPLLGLVRTIRDCCQRKESEMCRKIALTASQFACLLAIPVEAGEVNVHQVSRTMGISASRTSRIVESLVQGGVLSRRTTAGDRRVQWLALTPAGREKRQLAQKLLLECEEQLLLKLPPPRSRELTATLKELINAW